MTDLHTMLKEDRRFPPPPEFARHAHIQGLDELTRLRADAARNPEAFWARLAEDLHWFRRWHTVLDWQPPFAQWFVGGQINISDNCLDRHLTTWRRNKAALIWEGEPGDSRVLTYQDLHREVCRFANVLKTTLGVKPGDRVAIYMPMVPEIAIAMLACARIGAVHSVIFGGFSADAVRDRVQDAEARIVLTADGGWRRGATVALKEQVDRALEQCPSVTQTVVLRRTGQPVAMTPGRDLWWHEAVAAITERDCPAEHLDSEHPLFILYTSGSTGKPKGVLHTTAGYLLHTSVTAKWVFDLKDDDCYWCTADAGWVTGHSYVVYGPLANGATVVMYEGAPNHPRPDRFWELIEKYRVTILYTAPTAIRAFMKWGDQWPNGHDLTSLRLLGSVGEPINPEAWMWYQRVIGGGRCPIVDTWWQTETGGILITPIPGATPTKPGSATLPFPGIDADVVTRDGTPVGPDAGGFLVIRRPWPGIMRTIYKDPERFRKQYFAEIPGCYFAGDGARRDADGYFWVMGRVDDVIKVAGHRLGTSEVESALVSHPKVAESAVVGRPDELKGESIVAFVTLRSGEQATPELKEELRAHVSKAVGAIARPDEVRFSDALPKTRSGKIMRRLLRKIATGDQTLGDTSTLEDLSILAKLREDEE